MDSREGQGPLDGMGAPGQLGGTGGPTEGEGQGGATRAVGLVTGWWGTPQLSAAQAPPLEAPCCRQEANRST